MTPPASGARGPAGQAGAPVAPPSPESWAAAFGDLSCDVDVMLGTGTVSLRRFLQLQPSSVIRLAQPAGSAARVVVHGVTLASGELVAGAHGGSLRITAIEPPGGVEAG